MDIEVDRLSWKPNRGGKFKFHSFYEVLRGLVTSSEL